MEVISKESALVLINDIRNSYMIMIRYYAMCIGLDVEKMQKDTYEDIENRIAELKTIETNSKGTWIGDIGLYATCSNCRENLYQAIEYKYCPNCGSKMEERK